MESHVLMRPAVAVSVAGHLVFAAGLIFAEARPFDDAQPPSIAVDIVAPDEAQTPSKTPAPPQDFKAPQIADAKPATSEQPDSAPSRPQEQVAQKAAPQASETPPAAVNPVVWKEATPQPAAAEIPAAPSYQASEPDISVKYGVLLGLPPAEQFDPGGAAETTAAKVSAMDTAEFRRHLKTCSRLPPSVSPGDNIRIVLRVPFTTDGRIAAPPALIEASASVKGPALMQQAVKALVDCQPYAMLPRDKYDEWKVLDLSFTPGDFSGG